jgi:hypothetical protein
MFELTVCFRLLRLVRILRMVEVRRRTCAMQCVTRTHGLAVADTAAHPQRARESRPFPSAVHGGTKRFAPFARSCALDHNAAQLFLGLMYVFAMVGMELYSTSLLPSESSSRENRNARR